MIVIEENEVSAMQSGMPLIYPKAKGKGNIIEPAEKMSKVQADINASMIQVDESAKEIMAKFDACVDFKTVEDLIVLTNERRLKAMTQLEQIILEWAETDLISKSLQ